MADIKKPKKTFKEYYADPIFREKLKSHQKTKTSCPICNRQIARYNMSTHKKSQRCKLTGEVNKNNQMKPFREALDALSEIIKLSNIELKSI
jgi:hypothetical protein